MTFRPRSGRLLALLVLGSAALLTVPAAHVQAQVACPQVVPAGIGGTNSLLGQFFELGLRCRPGFPFQLAVGGRWSEQHPTINPFGILSYTVSLAQGWSASAVVSYRERLGDYEGNRLPDVSLRYFGSGGDWIPSLEISAGAIEVVQPSVRGTRLGVLAGLQSPVWRPAPTLELVGRARIGANSYDAGVTQSFYGGSLELTKQLGQNTRLGFAYAQQGGNGSSPLLYDLVGFEQVLTGRLSWSVSPSLTGVFTAAMNLHTPTVTWREYTLQFNSAEGWFVGAIYRVSDGRFFANFGF